MTFPLFLAGAVILLSLLLNHYLKKTPVPSLVLFLVLGMLFGENGVFHIPFDNYRLVDLLCSTALIVIMFYGGFGTRLQAARPVLGAAAVLSTLGVAGSALLLAGLAHVVLGLPLWESFLIGSVVSSTDAASVFSILRNRKLALKYHTDSLLEVESGSNDPMAFMLTAVAIALLSGESLSLPLVLAQQLLLGAVLGLACGYVAARILQRNILQGSESRTLFLLGILLLSYALPMLLGGNGYLGTYLCGIYIGNAPLPQKRHLVHFFDVLTQVAQVLIFFLLGLLVTPVDLPAVLWPALVLTLILTFVVRPMVVATILAPFRAPVRQVLLTSWAGLRGAASIVFAIAAILAGVPTTLNLFNLVFCMVLFSITIQGTLLPLFAKKLDMLGPSDEVEKTFTDYEEETDLNFGHVYVGPDSGWAGKTLAELRLPSGLIAALLLRQGGMVPPTGDTRIEPGDTVILAAHGVTSREWALEEEVARADTHPLGQPLQDLPQTGRRRILLIKRGLQTLLPNGTTKLQAGDILVSLQAGQGEGEETA
ncbi:MAG: Potassium/proton antiporter [Succiniclasticum sp.]|jgi:potassium/hydrogen antiporter